MAKNLSFGTRRLVSQEDSAMIARPDIPRATFHNRWAHKTTFNAGELIPFLIDEILPGDHMKYKATAYIRLATLIFPMFSNQKIDTFYFFVPSRILWNNWISLQGELNPNPPSSETPDDYVVPTIASAAGGFTQASLFDYMGLPTVDQIPVAGIITVNVLPFRAYNLIFNEWFRDENLVGKAPFNFGDGGDLLADYVVRIRAKAHDYFTSALPWPQKFTAPTIPVAGLAPITGLGLNIVPTNPAVASGGGFIESDGLTAIYDFIYNVGAATDVIMNVSTDQPGAIPLVFAKLDEATGVSINQLRQSFLMQQLLERDARGGTRYTEIMKSHFGVTSPDMRLQRPEYIGGGSEALDITPIAQTAPSTEDPVGTLGAAGISIGNHNASFAATEHGYVLGLISVRSELTYYQGIPKLFSRKTRYDFYMPSLAGLGEQAILRKEIFAIGDEGSTEEDLMVFGYQERWHEYRTRVSFLTGLFRPSATPNLAEWHLAQEFATAPVLGVDFIEDNPPMARVLAAGELTAGQQYLADIYITREATRPIPAYGTPVTLGRF